ncbi:MAG: hypothetical protein ACRDPT_08445 [Streptomycetales bacterium]
MVDTANDARTSRAADHKQGVKIAVATESTVYAPRVLWRERDARREWGAR